MYANNIYSGRGRLVYDPLEIPIENAKKVTFLLAINNRRKTRDTGYVDDVDFVSCEVWDSAAEYIIKHFKKGHHLEVVGSLKSYPVKVTKDGNEVNFYKSYIRVNAFNSIESNKSE
jgi:single-stranded DNA-binding protein